MSPAPFSPGTLVATRPGDGGAGDAECPACWGSGAACPTCQGAGLIVRAWLGTPGERGGDRYSPCPACAGGPPILRAAAHVQPEAPHAR